MKPKFECRNAGKTETDSLTAILKNGREASGESRLMSVERDFRRACALRNAIFIIAALALAILMNQCAQECHAQRLESNVLYSGTNIVSGSGTVLSIQQGATLSSDTSSIVNLLGAVNLGGSTNFSGGVITLGTATFSDAANWQSKLGYLTNIVSSSTSGVSTIGGVASGTTSFFPLVSGSGISITATNSTLVISDTSTAPSVFTGATGTSAGAAGLVPAPASGSGTAASLLAADGGFDTLVGGSNITVTKSGTTITISGSASGSGTSLTLASGGTGQSIIASQASGTATLYSLASGSNVSLAVSGSTITINAASSGTGGGSTTLSGLSDVSITSPKAGDMLEYTGTSWKNVNGATFDTPPLTPSAWDDEFNDGGASISGTGAWSLLGSSGTGGYTASWSNNGLVISGTPGLSHFYYGKAFSGGTAAFTVTAKLSYMLGAGSGDGGDLFVTATSGSTYSIGWGGTGYPEKAIAASYSGAPSASTVYGTSYLPLRYARLSWNGTSTLTYSVSPDGIAWVSGTWTGVGACNALGFRFSGSGSSLAFLSADWIRVTQP